MIFRRCAVIFAKHKRCHGRATIELQTKKAFVKVCVRCAARMQAEWMASEFLKSDGPIGWRHLDVPPKQRKWLLEPIT